MKEPASTPKGYSGLGYGGAGELPVTVISAYHSLTGRARRGKPCAFLVDELN